MVFIPSNGVDKETIVSAIREAVRAAGARRIGLRRFLASSSIKNTDIFNHFAKWTDALRAAGFDPHAKNSRVDDALLLEDWGAVAAKLGRIPACSEHKLYGKYEPGTIARRFGIWTKVPGAFRAYAANKPQWKKLLKQIPASLDKAPQPPSRPRRRGGKPARRIRSRPACGLPIVFDALLHAPVNELGVICLFSMMATRLGFFIDGLQSAFPDCYAKRPLGGGAWQHVAIEFEFESRSFRHHGHPPDGCDIIVCWHHNWPECPENIQVIELSEEIKRFAGKAAPCSHGPVGRPDTQNPNAESEDC